MHCTNAFRELRSYLRSSLRPRTSEGILFQAYHIANMDGTIFFMDGLRPDRASKKLMRRHVMKGKNAGKKLSRRSRLPPQVHRDRRKDNIIDSTLSHKVSKDEVGNDGCQYAGAGGPSMSCQPYNRSFVAFSAPFEVSPASIRVISLCA